MSAITTRLPAVDIEYDNAKGKRTTKHFEDANEAKRFFAAKEQAGKNPKVLGEETTTATSSDVAVPAAEVVPPTIETAKPTEVKKPKTPGVAPNAKTRAYWAGKAIAKHGHEAGVTEAMIAEVDELFGKPNHTESEICLRNAWHATRAYLEATATTN